MSPTWISTKAIRLKQNNGLSILESLRSRAAEVSDLDVLVDVTKIVALADNAHSEGRNALFPRGSGSLPFRGYWFDGEYCVLRTKPGLEHLLGSRITHIGGTPIGEIARRLKDELVGGPMEFFEAAFSMISSTCCSRM